MVDQISLGALTLSLPRDVVDASIAEHGRRALRRGGTLPPHVVMYFVVAMALFADADYEAVMRALAAPLQRWGGWDPNWRMPTASGIAQARQRLGVEPVAAAFEAIAVPVATRQTPGAFCAGRRLVSIDGMVFDLPATEANDAEFGRPSGGAFPQARVVTLTESASHATLGVHIGAVTGKGSGERSAARALFPLLKPDMLLICDRGFYGFDLWCQACATGADLLWRLGDIMDLPVITRCGDGSYLTLLFAPGVRPQARAALIAAAKAGDDLANEAERVRWARVVEYEVNDRGDDSDKELICLLTTIADSNQAPGGLLAEAYHNRWDHETANREIKTQLRGPGAILRSKSPEMVRQEIYGYLIAHYAISALICTAATETRIDPHRVKFTRTVRLLRERIAEPECFSP